MNEGLIPRRYAKALLAFAGDKGADTRVYDLMRHVAASFEEVQALQTTVANPFVSSADKLALVNSAAGIAPGDGDPVFDDFIKLLMQRGRIAFIRAIALAYIDLYRSAHHIYSVGLTSATEMTPGEIDRIKALVARHIGPEASLEFTTSVDPELIGGFTVTVGNELLDASIANELRVLRRQLVNS